MGRVVKSSRGQAYTSTQLPLNPGVPVTGEPANPKTFLAESFPTEAPLLGSRKCQGVWGVAAEAATGRGGASHKGVQGNGLFSVQGHVGIYNITPGPRVRSVRVCLFSWATRSHGLCRAQPLGWRPPTPWQEPRACALQLGARVQGNSSQECA